MEGENSGAQAPFIADQISQMPPIDNIHTQYQTMDNGVGMRNQNATPTQANPQQSQSYSTMPPTITAEVTAHPSSASIPTTTANNVPALSNATPTPAVPKDGKSAAQTDFAPPLPTQASAHGAPARQYLNNNLAPYLLEVSKHLAAHRPEKPLEFVAEYFLEKSRQIEGTK